MVIWKRRWYSVVVILMFLNSTVSRAEHKLSEEYLIIEKIFGLCMKVSKDREDARLCVRIGAIEAGLGWSCTNSPDGATKACTDAVWAFEYYYANALFESAKRAVTKP